MGSHMLTSPRSCSYIPYSEVPLTDQAALSQLDPSRNAQNSSRNNLPSAFTDRISLSSMFASLDNQRVFQHELSFLRGKHIGILGSS